MGHWTSKIVNSKQSCSNGHLPYHLFILVLSARARCMTWHDVACDSLVQSVVGKGVDKYHFFQGGLNLRNNALNAVSQPASPRR